MRLTYIYHSGFAIQADEFAILIDYYKDTGRSPEKGFVHEKLLNRAGTLYILSSISKKKILMKIITCGSRHSDQQTPAYPS